VRFENLQLSNFKCFEDAAIPFESGVTVIHGLNGSGKSTLLEGCFFALYGANALDRTLEDVVTTGLSESEIDLSFAHNGETYDLHRRIRVASERATTADCVLETADETVEGVQSVQAQIRSMLRMDAEAFVNCAYVQQGEVNRLITATPTERRQMIDDLLQLGALETYRERAGDARLAVEDVLDSWTDRLEDREARIAEMEAKNLHERQNAAQTERKELEAETESLEESREQARETLADAASTLEEQAEKPEELEAVLERIDSLRESISETESERDALEAEIESRRDELEESEDRIESVRADTGIEADAFAEAPEATVEARRDALERELEALSETIQTTVTDLNVKKQEQETQLERTEEFEARAATALENAETLEAEADSLTEDCVETRATIREFADRIEEARSEFEDEPLEVGGADDRLRELRDERTQHRAHRSELRETLTPIQSKIQEAEQLREAGNCPECGQPVEGSPHVETLEANRERVTELEAEIEQCESEIESIEAQIERAEELEELEALVADLESKRELASQRLEDRESSIEEKREAATEQRERAEELEEQAEEARETAAEAGDAVEALQTTLGERNSEQRDCRSHRDTVEELSDALEHRLNTREAIDRAQEKRAALADRNDERREHLSTARERKQRLEASYDDETIEEARSEKKRAESYLEAVAEELEETRERVRELDNEIGALENAIETLEELREEREAVADRVSSLRSLHEDAQRLEELYETLPSELRLQNIRRLEVLLNESFDLVYQNDSYANIELSGEYELSVIQKDGDRLEPEQLSGGERALFNLSLRCAIYRLLGEGIEGAAPMPPLILDEPTVFLDSGHVSRLLDVIESMRELGVEQILVVSHDDELLGAADDVVRVEKNATSNRSRIERDDPLEALTGSE